MRAQGGVMATVAAGLLLMGADPAPPTPVTPMAPPPLPVTPETPAARLARLFPEPRLFEVEISRDGKPADLAQFCVGADSITRQMDSVRAHAEDLKPLSTGCTSKRETTPDGGFRLEVSCDKAAGAVTTSHTVIQADGAMNEMRQRMELQMDMLQPPRTVVSETHMVRKGACPADLKPGEMRMPDGTKMDVAGMFGLSPAAK
jgi:hypothetical protein